MLIVASSIKRNLGYYKNERISDLKGEYHFCNFNVVREVTGEEYLKSLKLDGAPERPLRKNEFYYEIQMD